MKSFKHNLEILLLVFAVVFVWRGIWGLADLYLFPSNKTLSLVVSILIGLLLLYFHDKKKHYIDELLE